jgi:hypothetical protein
MKEYEVTITIFRESCFTDTIEAESDTDAEEIAQDKYWNDDYDMETRNTSETVDETYVADEIIEECLECGEPEDECMCVYDSDGNVVYKMEDQV